MLLIQLATLSSSDVSQVQQNHWCKHHVINGANVDATTPVSAEFHYCELNVYKIQVKNSPISYSPIFNTKATSWKLSGQTRTSKTQTCVFSFDAKPRFKLQLFIQNADSKNNVQYGARPTKENPIAAAKTSQSSSKASSESVHGRNGAEAPSRDLRPYEGGRGWPDPRGKD